MRTMAGLCFLGERLNGIQEVVGSIPSGSTDGALIGQGGQKTAIKECASLESVVQYCGGSQGLGLPMN